METSDWINAAAVVVALASLVVSIAVARGSGNDARVARESAVRSAAALERANELAVARNARPRWQATRVPDRKGRHNNDAQTRVIMAFLDQDTWIVSNTGPGAALDVALILDGHDNESWSTKAFPAARIEEGAGGRVSVRAMRRATDLVASIEWTDEDGTEHLQHLTLV